MIDMDRPETVPEWPEVARDERGAWCSRKGNRRFAVRETHGPMTAEQARSALARWVDDCEAV